MEPCRFDHIQIRSPDLEAVARARAQAVGGAVTDRVPLPAGLRPVLDPVGVPRFLEQLPRGTPAAPAPRPGPRIALFAMPDGFRLKLIERIG